MEVSVAVMPRGQWTPTEVRWWWSDDGLLEILGMLRSGSLVLLAAATLALFGRHIAGWW
jgi:hypothetical protein